MSQKVHCKHSMQLRSVISNSLTWFTQKAYSYNVIANFDKTETLLYITRYTLPFKQQKATRINMLTRLNSRPDIILRNKYVYLFGGLGPANEIYRINILTHQVELKSKLFVPKYDQSLLACKEHIYSIGGNNALDNAINDFESYLPSYNKCIQLPHMQDNRSSTATFAHNNEIYAVFGRDSVGVLCSTIEKYSRKEMSWSYITYNSDVTPRYCAKAAAISDNSIVYYGGSDGKTNYFMGCYYIIVEPNQMSFVMHSNLKKKSKFFERQMQKVIKNYLITMDGYKRIHIMDTVSGEWMLNE